jgi:hypothetical protein
VDRRAGEHVVMTRTYFKENLEPLRDHMHLIDSAPAFRRASSRGAMSCPARPVSARQTQVLPESPSSSSQATRGVNRQSSSPTTAAARSCSRRTSCHRPSRRRRVQPRVRRRAVHEHA